ncbi:MAG: diaminopimelate decarboxylase [Vampirovibrionales bacterium]|nr:diaminopimelate decarboxylase [Vampirovibrionales bacterium]
MSALPKAVLPDSLTLLETASPRLGEIPLETLAADYGTPLYIMDAATVERQANAYHTALKQHYPGEYQILYAAKANLTVHLAKTMHALNLAIDVVSSGELYTAQKAGLPGSAIYMNGNNKSAEEIDMALTAGIARFMVDNEEELSLIHERVKALNLGAKANVLLRVAPGIEAHTHDYLKTGNDSNKFGMPISQINAIVGRCLTQYADTLALKGLHAHIGSQIFDALPYQDLARIMLETYDMLRQQHNGLVLPDLDLGGGAGICYTLQDDAPALEAVMTTLAKTVAKTATEINYPLPRLLVEPGRSMVATAGVTLYTVGTVKTTASGRVFVAVDGGMGDNIRPALYGAQYSAIALPQGPSAETRRAQPAQPITLVGKYCESGDVLLTDWLAPPLQRGDLITVFGTGAYNYTMASTYNRIGRPAMVWVSAGQSELMLKRETLDALLSQDVI